MDTKIPTGDWLLYGAYGYTGLMMIEAALARGHKPLLAGRDELRLAPLARRYGLAYHVLRLDDPAALDAVLLHLPLVWHGAGPFAHTAKPMRQACLRTHTHYLDITGEVPVFQETLSQNTAARQAEVVLMSGVGFDVVPSDCLLAYVAQTLEAEGDTLQELTLAFHGEGSPSPGTTKTMLEALPYGGSFVRRGGRLTRLDWGQGARWVPFGHGKTLSCLPITWGDLATAAHTTGATHITTLMAMPPASIRQLRWAGPLLSKTMRLGPIRRLAQRIVGATVSGPTPAQRSQSQTYLWAEALGQSGHRVQAWLETPNGYQITVDASLAILERVLAGQVPPGATTPAAALGADFVLTLPNTRRQRIDDPKPLRDFA
jgi:short subunit dehydrogenase-like uncharacterized protein